MKLFLLFLSISMVSHAVEVQNEPQILFVKTKDGTDLSKYTEIKRSTRLFKNLFKVETFDSQNLFKKLKHNNDIIYVEHNQKSEKRKLINIGKTLENKDSSDSKIFNDPYTRKQWHLKSKSKGGLSVFDTYERRGSEGHEFITVAIVDTGVQFDHPDLIDNMWINEKEIPNNGIDDDNNGIIDDIHGANFINRTADGQPTGDMNDTVGHGTHVAGIIGAVQNNGVGVAGIASKVRLMGIKAVPGEGDETDNNVIEAFLYAAKNGAKIINCSFGKRNNENGMAVSDTIQYIGETYGVLVVAASGNDSNNIDETPSYPACFENENLLVVGSTSSNGKLSYFSNYGVKNVDIAAPGSNIYSTYMGSSYQSLSGTSMASPAMVGVAAHLLSNYPHLNVSELKNLIMDTVTKESSFQNKIKSEGRADLLNGIVTGESI